MEAASSSLRTVGGPSALGGDRRRFWHLTWTLAVTDFKLRFFGSALGYFWQLLRPLMLFGVLYVVFTQVVKFSGTEIKFYPAYLLMALVVFTFFAESTSSALPAVVTRENLVRKVEFPRMVIPLSNVVTSLFNLGLNFIVVFVFVLASGADPRPSWALAPLLLVPVVALATGFAMLLSALYVRFRDVGPIWDVALQVIFYGSPIFYTVEVIPGALRSIVYSSPLAGVMEQLRKWVLDPDAPTAADAIGGGLRLLAPAAGVVIVFALGLWAFNREAPRVAEDL
jgi:ABC-2 type transport system permease protein